MSLRCWAFAWLNDCEKAKRLTLRSFKHKKRKVSNEYSLLHRPLFTKLFTPSEPSLFPTTKHIISPATITREKRGLLTLVFDLLNPPYCNTVFSTPKVRESEWPGGLNLTNSSKANQPMWSSSWPNQPLRSNQLINCWGLQNTHENQAGYLCLPRNICKGYNIPISLCTKLIIHTSKLSDCLVKIEE